MDKKNTNLEQAIFERRSIFPKEFNGAQISDEAIVYLLNLAQQAPNHKLTYPWFFRVLKNKSKDKLFDYWASTNPDPIKKVKLAKSKLLVSHVLIITVKQKGFNPDVEEICATAAAVQNIYLGLTQYPSIAGYWGSGNQIYSKEFAKYIGLDENESCLGYFMIGGVDTKRILAHRKPIDEQVAWI